MSLKPGRRVLKACSSSRSEHPDELLEVLSLEAVPRGYLSIKKGNSSARVLTLTSTPDSMNTFISRSSEWITNQTLSISSFCSSCKNWALSTMKIPTFALSLFQVTVNMYGCCFFLAKKSYSKIFFLLSLNKSHSFFCLFVFNHLCFTEFLQVFLILSTSQLGEWSLALLAYPTATNK